MGCLTTLSVTLSTRTAFWHSSAHILGEALEIAFKGHLCIGPPIEQGGFYYDVALDNNQMVTDADYVQLQALVNNIVKDNQQFERMVITKAEALELFKDNKYKVQLIEQKIQVCFPKRLFARRWSHTRQKH